MTEQILIQGKVAELCNGQTEHATISIEDFAHGISEQTIQGLDPEPIPDHVKWHVKTGDLDILILQFPPELRMLRWIRHDSPQPFGAEALTAERQLATPYIVLKIPFRRGMVLPRVEVFYRNEPLRSLDGPGGELFWPNLLNVSPNAHGCTAWFCTQYLRAEVLPPSINAGLDAVTHHCFAGQHNFSSEAHEGMSTFSRAQQEGLDPRVTNVDRWEEESRKNPLFVLTVKWQSTGLKIGELIIAEMRANGISQAPQTVAELGNILLRKQKPK